MESGQYNKEWSLIHSKPEDVLMASQDMEVENLLPIHNSKFKRINSIPKRGKLECWLHG